MTVGTAVTIINHLSPGARTARAMAATAAMAALLCRASTATAPTLPCVASPSFITCVPLSAARQPTSWTHPSNLQVQSCHCLGVYSAPKPHMCPVHISLYRDGVDVSLSRHAKKAVLQCRHFRAMQGCQPAHADSHEGALHLVSCALPIGPVPRPDVLHSPHLRLHQRRETGPVSVPAHSASWHDQLPQHRVWPLWHRCACAACTRQCSFVMQRMGTAPQIGCCLRAWDGSVLCTPVGLATQTARGKACCRYLHVMSVHHAL